MKVFALHHLKNYGDYEGTRTTFLGVFETKQDAETAVLLICEESDKYRKWYLDKRNWKRDKFRLFNPNTDNEWNEYHKAIGEKYPIPPPETIFDEPVDICEFEITEVEIGEIYRGQ